jgi:hypothetical protein
MGKAESTQKQLQAARERERNAPRERLKAKQSKSTSVPPPSRAVNAFVHRIGSSEVKEATTTTEATPTGAYEVMALLPEEPSEPKTPAPRSKVACKKCRQALKARDYASKRAGVRLKS